MQLLLLLLHQGLCILLPWLLLPQILLLLLLLLLYCRCRGMGSGCGVNRCCFECCRACQCYRPRCC